jgi:phosphatidylinositol alpha-1,6-mannosyltransferase
MANRVFGGAKLLIANSENTAKLLQANWRVNDDRLRVLRPGVDTTTHVPVSRNPIARRRLGWGDRPVVLTVGRLQARKGQDHLIRAMAEIRQAIPNALYSVVGDGNDRGRLVGLVDELGLQNHVILQGELREDELIHAYQQCDLFALPNREVNGDIEGFGLVLLEAQACGKPVLAGDSGGTREAVGAPASGVVIDCSDPGRIADAVIEMLSDRVRLEEMGVAGREWVCRSFDWEICVENARGTFGLPALKPELVALNT